MTVETQGLRVLLTGAHGTGKTTLANILGRDLGWEVLRESARPVLEERGISEDFSLLPADVVEEAELEMLDVKQQMVSGAQGPFVSDRGGVDVYAYSLYWLSRHPASGKFLESARLRARAESDCYDLSILVPPYTRDVVARDGVRNTVPAFQQCIHQLISGCLYTFKYHPVELVSTDLDDRVEECKDYIYLAMNRRHAYEVLLSASQRRSGLTHPE